MFFHVKRKNYSGRWIIKLVQAVLIFGIVFYGLDFIGQLTTPQSEQVIVVEDVRVVQSERQTTTEPQLDQVDYFYRALDHQVAGNYYDAIHDYTRSLELDPNIAPSYLNRGVAYEQLGNNQYRAMQDFNQWMIREDMVVIRRSHLSNSATFTETMSLNYRYDIPITLNRGDVVSFSVISVNEDEVDPIVVLVDSDGQPVTANDDMRRQDGSLLSMNSYINQYEAVRSGQYTFMVSHAGGGSFGDVQIRLRIDN
ncbi:MAG: tetratricopeptide repeat protein [Anaerolineae bacterium]